MTSCIFGNLVVLKQKQSGKTNKYMVHEYVLKR